MCSREPGGRCCSGRLHSGQLPSLLMGCQSAEREGATLRGQYFLGGWKQDLGSKYSDAYSVPSSSSLLLGSPLESQPDSEGEAAHGGRFNRAASWARDQGDCGDGTGGAIRSPGDVPSLRLALPSVPCQSLCHGCHYRSVSGLHCEANFPQTGGRWRGKRPLQS